MAQKPPKPKQIDPAGVAGPSDNYDAIARVREENYLPTLTNANGIRDRHKKEQKAADAWEHETDKLEKYRLANPDDTWMRGAKKR